MIRSPTDVTDPADAFFVTYLNNRDFSVSMEEVVAAEPGVDAVQGAGSGILAVTAEALPGFVLADDAVSEWTWTFSTEVAPTGRPTDVDTEPTQPPAAGDGGGHDGGSLATTGAPRGIAAAAPALLGAVRVVVLRRRPATVRQILSVPGAELLGSAPGTGAVPQPIASPRSADTDVVARRRKRTPRPRRGEAVA
ncbi:hypothetical protein [Actinomadura sp. 7K507]|uniref:hypothetical protein n=1 Tax=Actinomadura sp. 7K507 TaxID=2530365 RepID=UPI001046A4AA|nr:hypothetical protein [Actinomadura sp. 7K507]TDC86933.1 hypothetical protein E1285_21680 [Actinomadura sp. 7K507]